MDIDINLLGGLALQCQSRPLHLPTRKAAALLALLARHPGRPVGRDRLTGLLWPDSAEAQARASLRQALVQVRRALPDGMLVTMGDQVRLNGQGLRVDVAELENLLAGDDPLAGMAVAALYRGRFLADPPLLDEMFEEWRRGEADRLHAMILARLLAWLARLAREGADDAALALGEALVAIDPTAEEAHRLLMRLHLRVGSPGLAKRQYERCANALRRELGVEPAQETISLLREPPSPVSTRPVDGRLGIAVLPFTNLSGEPEWDYLGAGLAEDIIAALARFRPLNVAARAASFTLAGRGLIPQEVGQQLGCRFILTGSVRPAPTHIRLGCALVDTGTGDQLWSHRFDMPLDAMAHTQDDIVRLVTGALSVQIDGHLLRQSGRCRPELWRSYDLWLRGTQALRRGDQPGLVEARGLFSRAIDLDAGNARAWSGLSLSYFNDWSCLAWDRWEENERQAFAHASRALDLDAGDHVAQYIAGRIRLYRRDFDAAAAHFDRAEQLNGNDPDTIIHLALGRAYLGDRARARALAMAAMNMNPTHEPWYKVYASAALIMQRDYATGLSLGMADPDAGVDVRAYLAVAHAFRGEIAAARFQADRFVEHYYNHVLLGRRTDAADAVRWHFMVNPFRVRTDAEHMAEGLIRAGLPVPDDALSACPPSALT